MSQILNARQLKAIQKIGDIYCPEFESFPSFSQLEVIEHIDILLAEIPESDLTDLKLLLTILGWMPGFFIHFFIFVIEKGKDWGNPLGPVFRMIRFGFRGIIFSLYYSDLKGQNSKVAISPASLIGYKIQVNS